MESKGSGNMKKRAPRYANRAGHRSHDSLPRMIRTLGRVGFFEKILARERRLYLCP